MYANIISGVISLSAMEAKRAGKLNSDEFNELQALQKAYPGFKIEIVKASSKKVDHMKGLNLKYIETYIESHPKDIEFDGVATSTKVIFNELRGLDANGEEIAFAVKFSFSEIKMWFLDTYPEIENHATQTRINGILNASKKNREAQRIARKAA